MRDSSVSCGVDELDEWRACDMAVKAQAATICDSLCVRDQVCWLLWLCQVSLLLVSLATLRYSTKVAALHQLTKSNAYFNLAENKLALAAFQCLKQAITTAPVLAVSDFETLHCCDGFFWVWGRAVLMQDDHSLLGGPKRPLAFFSARLSDAECAYHVRKQELLAVVSALKKWRCYLERAKKRVTVVTDNLPNTFLDTKSAEQFSWRREKGQLESSRISPHWFYEKFQTNPADPLSRCLTLLHASAQRGNARAQKSAIKAVTGHHLSMCDSRLHSHLLETASYGAADGAVLMTAVADASRSKEPDAFEGIV